MRLTAERSSGWRSRSGTTTSGNSRPLAWWIVIRRMMLAASGSVAASDSLGSRATNWESCVMKPSRSVTPLWSATRARSTSLLQVGELAFAEEFGEQDGVVAGAVERGVRAARRSGRGL